jgi:uncharacterized membrane protein
MTPDEQRELIALTVHEDHPPHHALFWQGELGENFYIIRHGSVTVTAANDRGEHIVLDRITAGGFFGEISLLDGGPRTATIRTAEPCTVMRLSRDAFHRFLRQHPDAAIDILTIMGQRQRASTDALRNVKNANDVFAHRPSTLWQRISDVVAAVAASQWFTLFHLTWFGLWFAFNMLANSNIFFPERWAFDPFPFGLLTMIGSLEAIFLSIFVMVSQNRQSEKDRLRIDLDYQVNLKAQTEIVRMSRKLDRLEAHLMPTVDEPQTTPDAASPSARH